MHITNEAGLPDALVRAVENDPYHANRTGDISCTRLINAPRIRCLTQRHAADITEDASDRMWSLLGQSVHTILERAHTVFEPAITERRLFAEIKGWQVSGAFDRLGLLEGGVMQDYKVTSAWGVIGGPKPEWEAQLNVLAWLAARNRIKVSRLEVVAILRDWSRGKARAGGNYPSHQVKVLAVPMWSKTEAGAYVAERVKLHQAAELLSDDELPECTPTERWQGADVFAVKKPGRKSAIKLHDTPEAAAAQVAELGGAHYLEHRPGQSVRCLDYCPVASFCNQWAAEQARQSDREAA